MNQILDASHALDAATFASMYAELSESGTARPLISGEEIRFSEIIAALSVALDITQGHAHGHCMRSCLIGMRIAEEIALPEADRSALFYALLLKDLGCSSNAARISYLFEADDLSVKHSLRMIDWTKPTQCLSHCWSHMSPGSSLWERVAKIWSAVKQGPEPARQLSEIRCTRGAEIARMLQLPEATAMAIMDLDEHWNGGGTPCGKKGSEISLLGRICCLAQTVEVFSKVEGTTAACDVARQRKGSWFDPELVNALSAFEDDSKFWQQLKNDNLVSELSNWEPRDQTIIADDACVDRVAEAFASVVDAKSPWTYEHSTRVADVAVGIARELNYEEATIKDVRRAALLHDVGKLGVSNRILDKPARPTDEEFAQIKLHPEFSYRILSQVSAFRDLAFVAAGHHEKLDGSGYHLGLEGSQIPPITRVLTVADIFEALTAKRPYRDAMPIEKVNEIMSRDIGTAIDADCYEALHRWMDRTGFESRAEVQTEQVEHARTAT